MEISKARWCCRHGATHTRTRQKVVTSEKRAKFPEKHKKAEISKSSNKLTVNSNRSH